MGVVSVGLSDDFDNRISSAKYFLQHDRAVETVLVETLNRDEPIAKVAWAMDVPAGSQGDLWEAIQ